MRQVPLEQSTRTPRIEPCVFHVGGCFLSKRILTQAEISAVVEMALFDLVSYLRGAGRRTGLIVARCH